MTNTCDNLTYEESQTKITITKRKQSKKQPPPKWADTSWPRYSSVEELQIPVRATGALSRGLHPCSYLHSTKAHTSPFSSSVATICFQHIFGTSRETEFSLWSLSCFHWLCSCWPYLANEHTDIIMSHNMPQTSELSETSVWKRGKEHI